MSKFKVGEEFNSYCPSNFRVVEDKHISKFKVGDKVIRTRNTDAPPKVGEEYTVRSVSGNSIKLEEDHICYYAHVDPTHTYYTEGINYNADYFELVGDKPISKFKVGDKVRPLLTADTGTPAYTVEYIIDTVLGYMLRFKEENGAAGIFTHTDGGYNEDNFKLVTDKPVQIDGVPSGYEVVRFGVPSQDEKYVTLRGLIETKKVPDAYAAHRLIVTEIETPAMKIRRERLNTINNNIKELEKEACALTRNL